MIKKSFLILFLPTCFLLSACGSRFHVAVNGFADPNHKIRPQATYVISPLENQNNDLEFAEYARMVDQKLRERGFQPADSKTADFALTIVYGINDGTQKSFVSSTPVYGATTYSGTSTGSSGTTFHSGTSYGLKGYQTSGGSYTVYKRELIIDVVDLAKFRGDGTVSSLWKGKVSSQGKTDDLREVMPYMIEASFMHFGENTSIGINHTFYKNEEAIIRLRNVSQNQTSAESLQAK